MRREKKRLGSALATYDELTRRTGDITAYFDLAHENQDAGQVALALLSSDLRREVDALRGLVEKLETETLLSGENDERSAIADHSSRRRRHRIASKTGPRC